MTTITTVTTALENSNFPTTGDSYSKIPQMTFSLVLNILHFGDSALASSKLGKGIKDLAIQLAKKDGRKPVICQSTFKTILL